MPQFTFKVRLSGTVSVPCRSEEEARKLLHQLDAYEWGRVAKIRKFELVAIDGKPPPRRAKPDAKLARYLWPSQPPAGGTSLTRDRGTNEKTD